MVHWKFSPALLILKPFYNLLGILSSSLAISDYQLAILFPFLQDCDEIMPLSKIQPS